MRRPGNQGFGGGGGGAAGEEGSLGRKRGSRKEGSLGGRIVCSDLRNVQQAMRNSDAGPLKAMRARVPIYMIPE